MRKALILATVASLAACTEQASENADTTTPDTQVNETADDIGSASADFSQGRYALNDDQALLSFEDDMSFSSIDKSGATAEGTWERSPEGQMCMQETGADMARCFSSGKNGNWTYTDPSSGEVSTLEFVPEGGTGA